MNKKSRTYFRTTEISSLLGEDNGELNFKEIYLIEQFGAKWKKNKIP